VLLRLARGAGGGGLVAGAHPPSSHGFDHGRTSGGTSSRRSRGRTRSGLGSGTLRWLSAGAGRCPFRTSAGAGRLPFPSAWNRRRLELRDLASTAFAGFRSRLVVRTEMRAGGNGSSRRGL